MMKKNKLTLFVSTVALVASMMLPSFASAAYFDDGIYHIRNKNSAMLMTVNGAQKYDGARIVQWYEEQSTTQKWVLKRVGSDSLGSYYNIINYDSGKLLDLPGGTGWGSTLIQWSSNGGTNQQWYIQTTVDGNNYAIRNRATATYVDVPGGSKEPGVNIIHWGWNGDENQKWYVYR